MEPAAKRVKESPGPVRTVPFDTQDFGRKIADELRRNGVVIVSGVFSAEECTVLRAEIIECFKRLNSELLAHDPTTWNAKGLPPQVRSGLFQGVVCNLPPVWQVRADPRVGRVFQGAYSDLRGAPQHEMFTSVDGINLRMPSDRTWHDEKSTKDWAHVDQTSDPGNTFKCIQGQVVLNKSSASFVCSPGSHLVLEDVLKDAGVEPGDKSNWCKFKPEHYPRLQARVRTVGGQWQIPVHAPVGSMILWLSSTVHAAKIQDRSDDRMRCVVYVCQRPQAECGATPAQRAKHAERLQRCIQENRATNHWGDRLFPKGSRYPLHEDTPPELRAVIEDPARVYDLTGKVEITPAIEALISALVE